MNTLWFRVCRIPASRTSAIRFSEPSENTIPRDRHMVTSAMFSMLE